MKTQNLAKIKLFTDQRQEENFGVLSELLPNVERKSQI